MDFYYYCPMMMTIYHYLYRRELLTFVTLTSYAYHAVVSDEIIRYFSSYCRCNGNCQQQQQVVQFLNHHDDELVAVTSTFCVKILPVYYTEQKILMSILMVLHEQMMMMAELWQR
eukprot:scaffold2084_cov155-Skeletonema_menzelii.AAC.20